MSTNYIDQITDTAGTTHDISEGDSTRIFRATCSTAESTAAKVATLDTSNRNFSLASGVRVAVTFTYGNTATTPTLRVDGSSTGTAKNMAVWADNSSILTGGGTTYFYWGPYETIIFTYDGTRWVIGQGGAIYKAYKLANSNHAHGNITSGGDITATAPTIASGDQLIINDDSASKVTNGPTFDGSTTTKALSQKGTWETFSNSLLYGECSTAVATVAKTVTVDSSFKLVTGATVAVKFSVSNTAASPTLNVNNTGAKEIKRYGTTAPSTSASTSWQAGSVVCFVYDGTYWQMCNWLNDNTMVTQNHSTSTSVYNMALANYSSSSGGTSTLNHSNKIQANPSTGDTLQSGRATTADLSSSDVTTFVNSLSFSQLVVADYVVEQGVSGNWSWRKWNSGIGECWLQYNPGSYTCGTTRGSLYSGGNLTLTFPLTFTSTPSVTGNVSLGTDAYVVWLQFNGLGTTTAQVRIVSSGSVAANSNYLISVQVIGRWK